MLHVVGVAGVDVEAARADVVLQPQTVKQCRTHWDVDGQEVVGVVAEVGEVDDQQEELRWTWTEGYS